MPRALASLQSVAIDGLVWACSTCTSMPLLRPARRASSAWLQPRFERHSRRLAASAASIRRGSFMRSV